MVPSVPPPSLSGTALTDWDQTEDTTDVLFEMPGVTVAGRTQVYERDSRFTFLTRLAFQPSLPSLFRSRVESMVLTAAKDRFTDRLTDRGATNVEYESSRTHPDAPAAVRIVPFQSQTETEQQYAGYLALCHSDALVLAGGAYPATEEATAAYKAELLDVFVQVT